MLPAAYLKILLSLPINNQISLSASPSRPSTLFLCSPTSTALWGHGDGIKGQYVTFAPALPQPPRQLVWLILAHLKMYDSRALASICPLKDRSWYKPGPQHI
jgi:hypothetical protein